MYRTALAAFAGVFALVASASAEERGWYMGLEGGVEFDGTLYGADSGWAGFVTVGKEITSHISLEGELGYRSTTEAQFWGFDINQATMMLNAVYEARLSDDVEIAIGAGAGMNHISIELDAFNFEESSTEVAVQLKLGLNVALSESTELTANYRYMETDSALENSTVTVGVRFAL